MLRGSGSLSLELLGCAGRVGRFGTRRRPKIGGLGLRGWQYLDKVFSDDLDGAASCVVRHVSLRGRRLSRLCETNGLLMSALFALYAIGKARGIRDMSWYVVRRMELQKQSPVIPDACRIVL